MKGRSILEASAVFVVFMAVTTLLPGVKSLIRWENRILGGSYFIGVLLMVLVLVASIVTRLDFEEIGLSTSNWRSSLNMGFKGFTAFLVPQFVMTMFWGWGADYRKNWGSALVLSVLVLAFTYLLAGNIGNRKGEATRKGKILMGIVLLVPFVIGFTYGTLRWRTLLSFIWQILVGGFAEELLYRGYIQSTVNREYGTNWRVRGISFGPGLLVSSIMYGLSRGLGSNLGWGLYAFTLGIFYGLIREASGDISGSGSANAIIDGFGTTMIRILR